MGCGWKLFHTPNLCRSHLQVRHKSHSVSGALAPEAPSHRAKSHSRIIKILSAAISAIVLAPAISVSTSAQSLPETVEAINKARVHHAHRLFITAHPDDEWASLLTYLSRGLNADVALLHHHPRPGRTKCHRPQNREQRRARQCYSAH